MFGKLFKRKSAPQFDETVDALIMTVTQITLRVPLRSGQDFMDYYTLLAVRGVLQQEIWEEQLSEIKEEIIRTVFVRYTDEAHFPELSSQYDAILAENRAWLVRYGTADLSPRVQELVQRGYTRDKEGYKRDTSAEEVAAITAILNGHQY